MDPNWLVDIYFPSVSRHRFQKKILFAFTYLVSCFVKKLLHNIYTYVLSYQYPFLAFTILQFVLYFSLVFVTFLHSCDFSVTFAFTFHSVLTLPPEIPCHFIYRLYMHAMTCLLSFPFGFLLLTRGTPI